MCVGGGGGGRGMCVRVCMCVYLCVGWLLCMCHVDIHVRISGLTTGTVSI